MLFVKVVLINGLFALLFAYGRKERADSCPVCRKEHVFDDDDFWVLTSEPTTYVGDTVVDVFNKI